MGDAIWVFGGRQSVAMSEAPLNDLWRLDLTSKAWTGPIVPGFFSSSSKPPCPRSFHKMVAVGHTLYVYGGCGADGRLADLHAFDTTCARWSVIRRTTSRA